MLTNIFFILMSIFCLHIGIYTYVPEVLNVHMNESKKKSTFFRRIFFQAVKN